MANCTGVDQSNCVVRVRGVWNCLLTRLDWGGDDLCQPANPHPELMFIIDTSVFVILASPGSVSVESDEHSTDVTESIGVPARLFSPSSREDRLLPLSRRVAFSGSFVWRSLAPPTAG